MVDEAAKEFDDTEELKTPGDWEQWGARQFEQAGLCFGHGTDNALDEALDLVLYALHLDHSIDASRLDDPLSKKQGEAIHKLLLKRIEERVPAAYLTHRGNFCGLPFYVDHNVLVPRSPIAELIVHQFQPWLPRLDHYRVLDLCTGSGCIGMASAIYLENSHVDITDISAQALHVASINRSRLELQDRVTIIESDLFDAIPRQEYDLIVSNPPYVDAGDMAQLPEEYRHEPVLGLAAGTDGLDLVTRILRQAREYLSTDGIMIIEVGNSEHNLQKHYPDVPFLWLEFEHGGHGVFLLTAQQLDEYAEKSGGLD